MVKNIKKLNKKARVKALIKYIQELKAHFNLGHGDYCIVHYGLLLAGIEKSEDFLNEVEENCEKFGDFYGIDALLVEVNIYGGYKKFRLGGRLYQDNHKDLAREILVSYT